MSYFPQTNCLSLITIDCYPRNSEVLRNIIDSFLLTIKMMWKLLDEESGFSNFSKRFVWVVCRSITSDFILCEIILQLSLQSKRSESTFYRIEIILTSILLLNKTINKWIIYSIRYCDESLDSIGTSLWKKIHFWKMSRFVVLFLYNQEMMHTL